MFIPLINSYVLTKTYTSKVALGICALDAFNQVANSNG